jgi:hypothetical protein
MRKDDFTIFRMQYKIILPKNYDMDIIRKRVQDNGNKTDGFPDLLFKAYLMTETDENGNFILSTIRKYHTRLSARINLLNININKSAKLLSHSY